MKFVDVKNGVAFRKIFGNENKKIILLSFLNAVMKLEGSSRIADVEILNLEQTICQPPRKVYAKAGLDVEYLALSS